jgi:hypothetical protein
MWKSEEYRQFAMDCIRIAQSMQGDDKQTLLKIAEAWEMRALETEKLEKMSGDVDSGEANCV